MGVIFINRFYWPDTPATAQLLHDLAAGLASRGIGVTVVASRHVRSDTPAADMRDGVHIVRVRTPSGPSIAAKATAFLTFSLGAAWRVFRLARRGDVLVSLTDPPLLGIAIGWVARVKGARMIHWIQDIYPEVAVAVSGNRLWQTFAPLRNRSWRRSDACVTVSTEMAGVVSQAGVTANRTRVIENWAPAGLYASPPGHHDIAEERKRWGCVGKFVVAYSGNLGRVHVLDPIIAAAEILRECAEIAFVFVGDGAQRTRLQDEVKRRGLNNVTFIPMQPRDRLRVSLASADIHLVTVVPGCERFVFPSKLYGIVAVGRPVLFVGATNSELSRLVVESGIGRAIHCDAPAELARVVKELAGAPETVAQLSAAAWTFSERHGLDGKITAWQQLLAGLGAC